MGIPRTIVDITPDWLTGALRDGGFLTSDQVKSVRFDRIGEGMGFVGDVTRLLIEYSGGSDDAPPTLVAKIAVSNDEVRKFANRAGLYAAEIGFYTELDQNLGVRIPRFYYGATADGYFVLLLEDLSHLRVGDETRLGSIEDAQAAVRNVARLHARWWDSEQLAGYQWLYRPLDPMSAQFRQQVYLEAWTAVSGHLQAVLHADVYEIGERLGPKLAQIWSNASVPALTLNHGDYRLANLFFDDDQIVTFDWQFAQHGPPAIDLADFLVWSLADDQRRTYESSLINLYVETLAENGVQNYKREQALQDCLLGMLRNLENYVISIPNLAMDSVPGQAWVDAVSPRMIALADWDCGALIPA